ncbi:MAG: efflux RND transporter periplasmic adaptor subunit [Gammaproteobacteria bacterium]
MPPIPKDAIHKPRNGVKLHSMLHPNPIAVGLKSVVSVCLIACWGIVAAREPDATDMNLDDPNVKLAGTPTDEALPSLHLEDRIQRQAGLQIVTLKPFQYTPEISVYGNAMAILPLLDLRSRYLSAQSNYQSAQARLDLAQQNMERTRYLHQNGIASKRALQEQQSHYRLEQAQTQGMRQQIRAIYDEASVNWGPVLTELFLSSDNTRLTPYLSGKKTLLLISLPAGQTLPDDIKSIVVSPSGDRSAAQPAEMLSIAPQTDSVTQGESYFFATRHSAVRAGMRIAAWLPRRLPPESGVLIPTSALIWHLGQAFVYLKTGDENFTRRRIAHFVDTAGGYFVQSPLTPGEQLVTSGAQLLLSEEFRGQIPDEDDD